MSGDRFALRSAVLAAIAVAAAAALPASGSTAPAACPTASELETLTCLINRERAARGLAPARVSGVLARSSRLRAAAMVRCRQFSHTPCGQSFASPFRRVGYARGSYSVAENIAWGTGTLGSPAATVQRWLSSPPHRRVLLAPTWRELGATVVGADGLFAPGPNRVWVAQFGRRG